MYPNETMATSSIPIPKTRRRYLGSPRSMSPVVEPSLGQNMVKGYAHLCFCEDATWFEGHLITNDGSQYGLTGNCPFMLTARLLNGANTTTTTTTTGCCSSDKKKVNNDLKYPLETPSTPDIPFIAYDITVNDHDDEETYKYPSVALTTFFPLIGMLSPRFCFTAQQCYRGQKADMLIQRYLTPRLVGKDMRVCAGFLTFDLSSTVQSLPSSIKGSAYANGWTDAFSQKRD